MTFQYIMGYDQYTDCSLLRLRVIKDYHMDTVFVQQIILKTFVYDNKALTIACASNLF